MRRGSASVGIALALVFLTLHLPYLPVSLEDLDSINFALGIRHFDVAQHQPHPPGYPVFIFAAKALHHAVPSEARALALLGVVSATLGCLAILRFFRHLGKDDSAWALIGTALAVTAPLYWFTANRPLSDATGLAASVAVQAVSMGASDLVLVIAAFGAGVATGIRSQVAWLTVPLLIFVAWGTGEATWGRRTLMRLARVVLGFGSGVLVWFIPLVILTGGPAAYVRVVLNQGAEDLSGILMLWTTPTLHELSSALYYALIAPWVLWPVGATLLVTAGAGAVALFHRDRRALIIVVVAFLPYFVFDITFQETFTTRYALPLVVPIAYLAAEGLRWFGSPMSVVLAVALIAFNAHIGGRSIAEYSRQQAPAFRMLEDMARQATPTGRLPSAFMDRREALDLRRPLVWMDGPLAKLGQRAAAPPMHEWLGAARQIVDPNGSATVWYIADPLRTDIELIQHGRPASYRWKMPYPVLLGGIRPNEMDWYSLTAPDWVLDEGWALTPEVAGVDKLDGRGLDKGPIDGWIRAGVAAGGLMALGGRNFDPSTTVRISSRLGSRQLPDVLAPPRAFFFTYVPLGNEAAGAPSGNQYAQLTLTAVPPASIAIEQFDAALNRPMVGFGEGWYEPEYNPSNGQRWRWLSGRGVLRVVTTNAGALLHLEVESTRKYYARPSRLVIRGGDNGVLREAAIDGDETIDVPLAPVEGVSTVTLETDQTHVPAEQWWPRTADRRRLGLRVFKCELRPAS